MPFLIGLCCVDQILTTPSVPALGLNEIVPFTNASILTIVWNNTRKARFGLAGVLQVELLGTDGIYRMAIVEVVPDSPTNTSLYTIDLGGLATGRVIIT